MRTQACGLGSGIRKRIPSAAKAAPGHMESIAPVSHRAKLYPPEPQRPKAKEPRDGMQTSQSEPMLNSLSGAGPVHKEPVWWALYVRHQHEKTVAETLSARGCEVFLPLYETVRRWKDREKLLSLPLFPGYVFVCAETDRRLQVVTTPGVHTILSCGGQFATIPEAQIRAIQLATSTPKRAEPHPFLECGQRVRVRNGPLEGVEGILIRKKNLCRLVLSVDMLGQSAAIDIDADAVELCSTAAHPAGMLCSPAQYATPNTYAE